MVLFDAPQTLAVRALCFSDSKWREIYLSHQLPIHNGKAVCANQEIVLSCHSNDVDVLRFILDCAFGGFSPPPSYSVVTGSESSWAI